MRQYPEIIEAAKKVIKKKNNAYLNLASPELFLI